MEITFNDVMKIVVNDIEELCDTQPFRIIDLYSQEGRTRIYLHSNSIKSLKFKRGRNDD